MRLRGNRIKDCTFYSSGGDIHIYAKDDGEVTIYHCTFMSSKTFYVHKMPALPWWRPWWLDRLL